MGRIKKYISFVFFFCLNDWLIDLLGVLSHWMSSNFIEFEIHLFFLFNKSCDSTTSTFDICVCLMLGIAWLFVHDTNKKWQIQFVNTNAKWWKLRGKKLYERNYRNHPKIHWSFRLALHMMRMKQKMISTMIQITLELNFIIVDLHKWCKCDSNNL